jgi:hypothetical protein
MTIHEFTQSGKNYRLRRHEGIYYIEIWSDSKGWNRIPEMIHRDFLAEMASLKEQTKQIGLFNEKQ